MRVSTKTNNQSNQTANQADLEVCMAANKQKNLATRLEATSDFSCSLINIWPDFNAQNPAVRKWTNSHSTQHETSVVLTHVVFL